MVKFGRTLGPGPPASSAGRHVIADATSLIRSFILLRNNDGQLQPSGMYDGRNGPLTELFKNTKYP